MRSRLPQPETSNQRLTAVGRRLRELRSERGLSLSALARAAGIGKGSLSELEAGLRNPTLETLYALALPLEVPLASLLGDTVGAEGSDDVLTARLLDVRHHEDGGTTEVYWLQIAAVGTRVSPPHGPSVTEHLYVVRGTVQAGPVGQERLIKQGRAHTWPSDTEHTYTATKGAAEAVLTIDTAMRVIAPPSRTRS